MDETTSAEVFVDDAGVVESLDDSMDSAIDSAWDDEPTTVEETEEETEETTEDSEEETETEPSEEQKTEQDEPKAEEPKADDDWWKTMKVLGETKTVATVEEAKALMQKGADYDRIRAERDSLKAERNSTGEFEAFVKELAEASNVTPEELMETTRIRFAMSKDKTLTQEKATEQVRSKMAASKAEAEAKAKRDSDMVEFVKEYPNVKGEDIPQEIWDAYSKGKGTLTELYGKHLADAQAKAEADEVKKENERLKAELETLRENQKNKERSTGSTKSRGSGNTQSLIDKYWYDD